MDRSKESKPRGAQRYLDSEASLEDLVMHMPAGERSTWMSYGHLRVEPTFMDRVFIVYEATGRDDQGAQLAPNILTTIRAVKFIATDQEGCRVTLLNEKTNETVEAGHNPQRIFGLPIFVAVPPLFTVRWDLREHAGKKMRTLSYLIFIKTRNRADFYSKNNTYMETPNKLRDLYPHLNLKLDL